MCSPYISHWKLRKRRKTKLPKDFLNFSKTFNFCRKYCLFVAALHCGNPRWKSNCLGFWRASVFIRMYLTSVNRGRDRSQINASDNIVYYYNCSFALFIFRLHIALAVHRGTCLRPLHIFAFAFCFALQVERPFFQPAKCTVHTWPRHLRVSLLRSTAVDIENLSEISCWTSVTV